MLRLLLRLLLAGVDTGQEGASRGWEDPLRALHFALEKPCGGLTVASPSQHLLP